MSQSRGLPDTVAITPGSATTTLTWKTYLTTFENLDFGLGNAYAYVVSLITFGFALVYFRVLYRRGDFEA